MTDHHVNVTIDEQVAVTTVEQTFRNHTNRPLEADLCLPGAERRRRQQVHHVGQRQGNERASWSRPTRPARSTPTSSAARRIRACSNISTTSLFKLRVFPVPANGDQKIPITYTSVAPSDNGLIEYVYPLRSESARPRRPGQIRARTPASSRSMAIQNVYQPTHAITCQAPNDRQAVVSFAKDQAIIDKDFQLFYTISTRTSA